MCNITKEGHEMNQVYTDLEGEANVEQEFQEERIQYHELIAKLTKMVYDNPNDSELGSLVRKELMERTPKDIETIDIDEYKNTKHKLYTTMCVLSASGDKFCIYKDVDDMSRPVFTTQNGFTSPHKYKIIEYLKRE